MFICTCEQSLAQTDLREHQHFSSDTLWKILNDAVVDAAQACYKRQNKHSDDPADTKEAHETIVVARAALASLLHPCRFSVVYQTNISMDFMSAILQQWRGLARYWKARTQLDHLAKRDRRHRTQEQLAVFNNAWQRRDFAEMWQTARFLSRPKSGT